ncbi:hypothetical protein EDD11_009268 [Mortierella claussenii]|nr:hypothetical protein EDD11_009268 [Mortierella claussenii]
MSDRTSDPSVRLLEQDSAKKRTADLSPILDWMTKTIKDQASVKKSLHSRYNELEDMMDELTIENGRQVIQNALLEMRVVVVEMARTILSDRCTVLSNRCIVLENDLAKEKINNATLVDMNNKQKDKWLMDIAALENGRATMADKCISLEGDRATLQKELADLNATLIDINNKQRDRFAAIKVETAALKDGITTMRGKCTALEDENNVLKEEVDKLKRELHKNTVSRTQADKTIREAVEMITNVTSATK